MGKRQVRIRAVPKVRRRDVAALPLDPRDPEIVWAKKKLYQVRRARRAA